MIGPAWREAPHPEATDEEGPGQWRRHDIQQFAGGMKPPPWTEIQSLITDWLVEVDVLRAQPNRTGERLPSHPVAEAVARVHARFEQIHPFLDGNGRTGPPGLPTGHHPETRAQLLSFGARSRRPR
jgi:Fic family protein